MSVLGPELSFAGAMEFRIQSQNDVRLFAVVITLIVLVASTALQYLMLPQEMFATVAVAGAIQVVMLAAPISYFIGTKIRDVNDLALQLEHAVNHDNLTGACTRLNFYHRVSRMDAVPMVMIAADIDHFKKINDTFGHQAGDSVLKQFTNTLVMNCREEDIIARFGGEEFVLLMPDASVEKGVNVAQRLCDRVRSKNFVAEGNQLKITASFGVAKVTSLNHIDDAIHRADLAAYRAKRQGRDQVCEYDPELDSDRRSQHAAE